MQDIICPFQIHSLVRHMFHVHVYLNISEDRYITMYEIRTSTTCTPWPNGHVLSISRWEANPDSSHPQVCEQLSAFTELLTLPPPTRHHRHEKDLLGDTLYSQVHRGVDNSGLYWIKGGSFSICQKCSKCILGKPEWYTGPTLLCSHPWGKGNVAA